MNISYERKENFKYRRESNLCQYADKVTPHHIVCVHEGDCALKCSDSRCVANGKAFGPVTKIG